MNMGRVLKSDFWTHLWKRRWILRRLDKTGFKMGNRKTGRGVGKWVRIGADRGRGKRKSLEVIDPEWISFR